MTRVVLSLSAREDRRELTAYTAMRFGVAQARALRDRFAATFELLARAPEAGRLDPDLDPEGWTFRYLVVLRRFLVVYDVQDDVVPVARILHGSLDLTRELNRDPG